MNRLRKALLGIKRLGGVGTGEGCELVRGPTASSRMDSRMDVISPHTTGNLSLAAK